MSSAEKRPAPASRTVIEHPPGAERVPAPPSAPRKTNGPPPGVASSPDMGALLGALRRRWLLVLSLGLTLAGSVAAALWYFLPARYTAFAYVRVMVRPDTPWEKGEGGRDFFAFLKTQAARLKSPKVFLDVLGDPDNVYKVRNLPLFTQKPDPHSRMTFLDEELKVEFAETSELLKLEFNYPDPEDAVRVVDAVTKAYVARAKKEEAKERKARTEHMEGEYNKAKKKYDETYDKLDSEQKNYGGTDPISDAVFRNSRLQELQVARQHLEDAELKLKILQQREKQLEKRLQNLDDHVPAAQIDEAVSNHLSVKDLEARVEIGRADIKRMVRSGYLPTESYLVKTRHAVADLEKTLAERKQKLRKSLMASERRKLEQNLTEQKEQIGEEIPLLEQHIKQLTDRIKKVPVDVAAGTKSSGKVEALRNELKAQEVTLGDLSQHLKVYQAEEKSPPRVKIEQEATWQDKDLKRRLLMLVGGFLGTFFLAALGVSYVEFRSRKIHSAREVVVGLNMKVLGAVPDWPQAGLARFIGPDEGPPGPDKPSLIEAIDGIRTLLLRGAGEQGPPVVMVTSAVEGEGKTTLASNLALSVARSGRKTLFVDCDLRRPSAHQLFEQTLQPGFSELVLGEVDLGAALRPTTTEQNLWLLPAGQWDRAVVQELARNGVQDLFAQLRAEFDFIILDSHPLLPATDSLLIGQHVDGVIISVLHDVSQTPKVYAACQRLETLGIPCFGAVVNGTASSY